MPVFFRCFLYRVAHVLLHTGRQFAGPTRKALRILFFAESKAFACRNTRAEGPSEIRLGFRPAPVFHGERIQRQMLHYSAVRKSRWWCVRSACRSDAPPRVADACAVPTGHCVHDDCTAGANLCQVQASQQLRLFQPLRVRERWGQLRK